MFVRKNKILKEIDAMIEDANHYIDFWNKTPHFENEKRALKAEIDALDTLRYFIQYNKRWRPLRKRNGDLT